MNIGEAAKATGISTKMLRYYESIDLLQTQRHAGSGYRSYTENDIHTLRFIRQARALGFSIEHIRTLLQLSRDQGRSSADVKEIALKHLADLNRRIMELTSMHDALFSLVQQCPGDDQPACPILEALKGERLPGLPRLDGDGNSHSSDRE